MSSLRKSSRPRAYSHHKLQFSERSVEMATVNCGYRRGPLPSRLLLLPSNAGHLRAARRNDWRLRGRVGAACRSCQADTAQLRSPHTSAHESHACSPLWRLSKYHSTQAMVPHQQRRALHHTAHKSRRDRHTRVSTSSHAIRARRRDHRLNARRRPPVDAPYYRPNSSSTLVTRIIYVCVYYDCAQLLAPSASARVQQKKYSTRALHLLTFRHHHHHLSSSSYL